jgi:hypothetical protein
MDKNIDFRPLNSGYALILDHFKDRGKAQAVHYGRAP